MYLKLIVSLAFVAFCGADFMGHIFIDVGLNGIRITNKYGMELDIKMDKLSGMYEAPMIHLEMAGAGIHTPVMIKDRHVGYQGMRQSDILYHIFRKYTGPVNYMDCKLLLSILAEHVERGEIDPTILKALHVVCQMDKDTLMMDRIYDMEDPEMMMHKLPVSYRRLGLFERRHDMRDRMMYPSHYSTMDKTMDHSRYPFSYGKMDKMMDRTMYPWSYKMTDKMMDRSIYPWSYKMMDRTMYPRSYEMTDKMMDRTMYPRSYEISDRTMYPRLYEMTDKMMDRTMYPRSYEMTDRTMFPWSYSMTDKVMDQTMDRTMYPRSYGMWDTMRMPTKSYYKDLMMDPMRMRMMRGNMMMDRMHDKMYYHETPCCA